MITVRPANNEDVEICSDILRASITQLCVKDHHGDNDIVASWTSNKDANSISRWIADKNGRLFVAEVNGVVCGVGAISQDGVIVLNYVAPAYRFKGVSKAMLVRLENELRIVGIKAAKLVSTETAHGFYKAAGWLDSGEPDFWLGMKGYPMVKEL